MSISRFSAALCRIIPNVTPAGRGIALVLSFSLAILAANSKAAEVSLLEQDPYDTIRLDAASGHAELKVEPLKFPDRQIPPAPKPTDKLDVQLLDDAEKVGSIEWRSIEKIILFEDRILDKANSLVAANRLDEAYDHFRFLFDRYPRTAGLLEGYNNYLYEDAKACHNNRKYDEALASLRQIYATDPKRPGLDKAMGLSTDKLVEQYVAQNRCGPARVLLLDLTHAFPGHPVATAWSDRIRSQAESYLHAGQAAAEKGDWSKAAEQSRLLTALWPSLPGAKELAQDVQKKYPRIIVGVMSAPQQGGENALVDWTVRRDRRLFYRMLTEYLGPGMEGGKYICPVGECRIDSESLGRRLLFQLKPDVRWAGDNAPLSAYDVSRRLCVLADPANPEFSEDWGELFQGVSLNGLGEVQVELRRPHVRPEALLQTRLLPYGESYVPGSPVPSNGPFMAMLGGERDAQTKPNNKTAEKKWTIPPLSTSFTDSIFQGNPQYFALKPTEPQELIERHYPMGVHAIRALKQGEIQVLDRIAPWNLNLLKNDPKITIGKYGVPLVHCLVPNFRRPLPANRTFRRALAYGLNREAILSQLVGKEPIEGCRVVSGPFSAGISNDDPLNYAYDERIEPRPCDPRMAMALGSVAALKFGTPVKIKDREVKRLPKIVLAHPDDEIATAACASIKYQLNLVHIEVELRPISGPLPDRIPDDVDLLYAELAMGEPVTDAGRLFGEHGLAGGSSPYVALAVKQLEQAADWAAVRDQLRRLHRITFDDVTVIPLWQLVDFYAYRKGNRGIGEKPFTIYQNIEQWQPAFSYPEGE